MSCISCICTCYLFKKRVKIMKRQGRVCMLIEEFSFFLFFLLAGENSIQWGGFTFRRSQSPSFSFCFVIRLLVLEGRRQKSKDVGVH